MNTETMNGLCNSVQILSSRFRECYVWKILTISPGLFMVFQHHTVQSNASNPVNWEL